MENMYMVLGYRENLVVQAYRKKQYATLLELLEQVVSKNLFQQFNEFSDEEKEKFLVHPDQSSILKCLSFVNNSDLYLEKLIKELNTFITGEDEKLIMNSGTRINGTNIFLSTRDNNPLNSIDIHPDEGGKIGWGEKSIMQWQELYSATFDLLKQVDIGFFDELNELLQKIVPFGTAKHTHYSASFKECVGTLYMGYTLESDIPELHVLEGLIHESSHNKLNLIMQYEDITLNNFEEKYYSPYRPDARHIYGVFLGIHALTPTVYTLLQGVKKGLITDSRWLDKIVLYHIKNKLGIASMKKFGVFSNMGQQVFQDIIHVAQKSDPLIKNLIIDHGVSLEKAQFKAKEHFMEVFKNYPHLQY